jgi:hypothetical protein
MPRSALQVTAGSRCGAGRSRASPIPSVNLEKCSKCSSERGERGSARRHTVLDVVMIISVGLVWLAFAIWLLTFPHTTPLA